MLVINGHSHVEIFDSLNYHSSGKPIAILAHTIKGHGIKEMEAIMHGIINILQKRAG